ncbi:Uncharacterized protein YR821_0625 [Yersinia ruckeri]|nr:hypothetical protein yruck0001_24030 [Yersinia ruckeri ATCC 29473]QTD75557.1 Uncharacterized protein YR821_0625 [Yersinia ruckeri]
MIDFYQVCEGFDQRREWGKIGNKHNLRCRITRQLMGF